MSTTSEKDQNNIFVIIYSLERSSIIVFALTKQVEALGKNLHQPNQKRRVTWLVYKEDIKRHRQRHGEAYFFV
jgi:CRISPR/Cas system endoribonuclease Cas6 (RAMP superfamily)